MMTTVSIQAWHDHPLGGTALVGRSATGVPRGAGRWILWACAVVVAAISIVSIIGWQTRSEWMVRWRSESAPMHYNTALGTLGCAIGLVGFAIKRGWVAAIGALIALSLGVVSLVQYAFETNVGLDTLFVDPFVTDDASAPGRMSPRTAFVLVMFGLGVLVAILVGRGGRSGASTTAVGLTGGMVIVIPLMALMRRLAPGWDTLWWDETSAMAVPTALGVALVAVGLFAEAGSRDRAELGRWTPWLLGAMTFTVSSLMWRAAIGAASSGLVETDRVASVMLVASSVVATLAAIALMGAHSTRHNLVKARAALAELAVETAHRQQIERELAAEEIARLRAEYDSRTAAEEQRRLREVAERERVETELWKARRLEGLGHLAGGIAHDFNNVLQIIHNASELARAHAAQPAASVVGSGVESDLDLIDGATDQARRMIRQLLSFTRDDGDRAEPLDLAEATEEAETLLAGTIGRGIDMRLAVADDVPPVAIERGRYEQLLLNLVVNARDAMDGSGCLCVSIDRVPADDGGLGQVRLLVADTGSGIPDGIIGQLFDPFFTTKARGTGLGLSTVFKVAEGAGGSVGVASTGPGGTTFEVLFPAAAVAEQASAAPSVGGEPSLDGVVVLVVDDDAILLEVAKRLLVLAGCEVLAATSGDEAIETARSHEGTIDIVLTDLHMPGLDGLEVATSMAEVIPDAAVVLMSGSGRAEVADAVAAPVLLDKPFGQAELRSILVRALLDRQQAAGRSDSIVA